MVAAPLKANGVPLRERSKAARPASKFGFADRVPRHWPTVVNEGSPTGLPSASRHGELNAGSVKPRVNFSSSFVAPIVPPSLTLWWLDVYARSALAPRFVRLRFCDTVAGVSADGAALGREVSLS